MSSVSLTLGRQFIVNPAGRQTAVDVMTKIASLSASRGLGQAHATWLGLRRDGDGSGKATIADVALVESGESVFWHASTRADGEVFLRRPAMVLRTLENL